MVCAILSLASGAGTCACTCTCTLCTCAALFALPCLFVRVRECCRAQRTCTLQQSLWGQVQKPTPSKKGRAQASMIHNTVFGNRENTVRITEVKYLKRRGEARPTRLTGCRSRWNRRSCALAQSSSLSLSTQRTATQSHCHYSVAAIMASLHGHWGCPASMRLRSIRWRARVTRLRRPFSASSAAWRRAWW